MNLTDGYKVTKPITYQKKCRYCGSIIAIPHDKMNFKGPTFAECPCGHNVQFTDDIGQCPSDVSFFYDKEQN